MLNDGTMEYSTLARYLRSVAAQEELRHFRLGGAKLTLRESLSRYVKYL